MIGPLISAGASIVGGLLNRKSAKDAQAATQANLAQQYQQQKEFAQNGIKWRAKDAKDAGIHPLYALGASIPSYTPQSVSFAADNSIGNSLASAGQDIGRAINATRTQPERDAAFSSSVQRLQIQGMELDNQIKQASLASSIQRLKANANPPLPIAEANKADERPLGFVGGQQVATDPGSSNVDDFWAKRYGEPGEWLGAPLVMWQDYKRNYGQVPFKDQVKMVDSWTQIPNIGSMARSYWNFMKSHRWSNFGSLGRR